MKPLLAAKLAIVFALIAGSFVLVGLGKVSFSDAVKGTTELASALVVALGIRSLQPAALSGAADKDKTDGSA